MNAQPLLGMSAGTRCGSSQPPVSMDISSSPVAPFRHLQRLTDNVGILERAYGIVPRYEHGYRVDDVARGLVVVCREPSPSDELITLGRRYLYFLAQAQAADGKFRNHLGDDRRWRGKPEVQDAWGRSLWALGTAAARGPTAGIRRRPAPGSTRAQESVLRIRIPWRSPHSVPPRYSSDGPAMPVRCRCLPSPVRSSANPQPTRRGRRRLRLSYANAAIAEAVIVTGEKLAATTLRNGLRMLDWLLAGETRNGHLWVVPAEGWGRGESRPAFDQHRARWQRSRTPACGQRRSPATAPG